MKIIVAITAASGSIYARQIIDLLNTDQNVKQIAIIMSKGAHDVMNFEREAITKSDKITHYQIDDMFAAPASGSSSFDAMIIAPCSTGTACRVANGISDSLLTRSADVMLKERRPLIMVLRETPLSLIHLRALTTLTEAGATILPAAPSFYSQPSSIEELVHSVSSRAVQMAGCNGDINRWEDNNQC